MRSLDLIRAGEEVLSSRALIHALVVRDLKARYRVFGLGYLWSLFNPLLQLAVYSWIFREILKSPIPAFTVFLAAGLFPWTWFTTAISAGATSVIHGGSLVRRMYFPSQILPIVVVIVHLVHFLLSLPILFFFVLLFKRTLGLPLLALPVVVLTQLVLTVGVTLLVAALTVKFRDLEFLIGNFLLLLFFLTPILYPLEQMPGSHRTILLANPMTSVIDGYQRILYENVWPNWHMLGWGLTAAAAVFAIGWMVFEAKRWSFAEEV